MSTLRSHTRPSYPALIIIMLLALIAQRIAGRADSAPVGPIPNPDAVPCSFSGWMGWKSDLDDLSRQLLKPDAYVVRQYKRYSGSQVEDVEFLLTYGRTKSNFHSPANCFLGSGWAINEKRTVSLPTADKPGARSLEMTRMLLTRGDRKEVVLYSFLSSDESTASWPRFQARLLGSRLMGKKPPGALLRFVVQVTTTEQAADRTAIRLLKDIYPHIHSTFAL